MMWSGIWGGRDIWILRRRDGDGFQRSTTPLYVGWRLGMGASDGMSLIELLAELRQWLGRQTAGRLAALEMVTGIGPFVWGEDDLGRFFLGEPREFNGLPRWVPLEVADRAVRERERQIEDLRLRIAARRDEIVMLRGEVKAMEEALALRKLKLAEVSKDLRHWRQAYESTNAWSMVRKERVFELEQAMLHVLQAVMGCQLYGVVSRKVEAVTDVERAIVEIDRVVRSVMGDGVDR